MARSRPCSDVSLIGGILELVAGMGCWSPTG